MRVFGLYFCNWAIYARSHTPVQLPADDITHVIYAFAKTNPESGAVSLSDPWADCDKKMECGGAGCLGELYEIKKQHRQLRVLLSIGGWTYSGDLRKAFASEQGRHNFASTAVQIVDEYSLDGVDVDFEYPENDEQAGWYVQVLSRLRLELDSLALRNNLPRDFFDLSVAAPAGPEQVNVLHVRDMDKYLSFWNIMAYDFAGQWSQQTDHQASLYGGQFSGDGAIQSYISRGVAANKLVLGMPLYGRSFDKTKGLGHSFSGCLPGKYEAGTHDAKDLPLPGMKEHVDKKRVAAYCCNDTQFVSYDTAETIRLKADYCKKNHLAGGMWWESSGDRKDSIVRTFVQDMGGPDYKPNWLKHEG